ncbi:MAG: hypothetical protein ACYDHO_01540 [Gaiellaceae bacterium]
MNRLHLPVFAALVLAALVLSGSGAAAIVPQHSIAGIRLGMDAKAVRAKLGSPRRILKGSNFQIGPWRRYIYPQITVVFQRGQTRFLLTKSAREKTPSGIGVGSTLKQVRAGLRRETCKRMLGYYRCWTGHWQTGRLITEFRFEHFRVIQVSLGYVID